MAGERPDDYNDEYPTCEGTYVDLCVYSSDLEPAAVTGLLGVAPSRSHRLGDRIGSGPALKTHAWILSSEDLVSSRDVRRHVDWLLDQVDESGLIELTRDDRVRAVVSCFWSSKSGHGGPMLSPVQLGRLARTGLRIELDVYFPRFGESGGDLDDDAETAVGLPGDWSKRSYEQRRIWRLEQQLLRTEELLLKHRRSDDDHDPHHG